MCLKKVYLHIAYVFIIILLITFITEISFVSYFTSNVLSFMIVGRGE